MSGGNSTLLSSASSEIQNQNEVKKENQNPFDRLVKFGTNSIEGLKEDAKQGNYGSIILKGGLLALGGWLLKEAIQGVGNLVKSVEKSLFGISNNTEKGILETTLGKKFGIPALMMSAILLIPGFAFADATKASKGGDVSFFSYILGLKNIPDFIKKFIEEKIKQAGKAIGVDQDAKQKIETLIDNPSFKNGWEAGKTQFKGILNKLGISNEFIDKLDDKIIEIMKDAGFTNDKILEFLKTETGSGVKLAGSGIILFAIGKYLLKGGLLGLLGKTAKLSAVFLGVYLGLKLAGIDVPVADEHIKDIGIDKEKLKLFDGPGKIELIKKFLDDPEKMKSINEFIDYIQKRAGEFWVDLKNLPGVGDIMPGLDDIKNLNPINFVSLLIEGGLTTEEMTKVGTSAGKIGLITLIFKLSGKKTLITGIGIFALYCLYQEGKEKKQDLLGGKNPEDFTTIDRTLYETFKIIDEIYSWFKNLYDEILQEFKKDAATKEIGEKMEVISRPKPEGKGLTKGSPEWLSEFANLLKNSGTGLVFFGSLWVLVKKTGLYHLSSRFNQLFNTLKGSVGLLLHKCGLGGDSLASEGAIELGTTTIKMNIIGKITPKAIEEIIDKGMIDSLFEAGKIMGGVIILGGARHIFNRFISSHPSPSSSPSRMRSHLKRGAAIAGILGGGYVINEAIAGNKEVSTNTGNNGTNGVQMPGNKNDQKSVNESQNTQTSNPEKSISLNQIDENVKNKNREISGEFMSLLSAYPKPIEGSSIGLLENFNKEKQAYFKKVEVFCLKYGNITQELMNIFKSNPTLLEEYLGINKRKTLIDIPNIGGEQLSGLKGLDLANININSGGKIQFSYVETSDIKTHLLDSIEKEEEILVTFARLVPGVGEGMDFYDALKYYSKGDGYEAIKSLTWGIGGTALLFGTLGIGNLVTRIGVYGPRIISLLGRVGRPIQKLLLDILDKLPNTLKNNGIVKGFIANVGQVSVGVYDSANTFKKKNITL